jgi:hypothetical protein
MFRKTANEANFDIFRDQLFEMGNVIPATLDLELALQLTYGNQSSYVSNDNETVDTTTGDNLPAWHWAHTLTGSTKTYRTILYGNPGLSNTSIAQAANHFHFGVYNNLGEASTGLAPDSIIITMNENLQRDAFQYMKSTADVNAPNNGVKNYWEGRYDIITQPRLGLMPDGLSFDPTRLNMWIMACRKASNLTLVEFAKPEMDNPMNGNSGHDVASGDWSYVIRGFYGIGHVSSMWAIVSFGTGVNVPGDVVNSF